MTTQEFNGLYAEVVTADTYRLRQLDFTPDIVFDFGANWGVFTNYAHSLWPKAKIVAVEPDPSNINNFRALVNADEVELLELAIGRTGELYHNLGARNGTGEVYITKGLGYPNGGDEPCSIAAKMPHEIIVKHWRPNMRSVVKIDIEGAENIIWDHYPSMKILRKMDYICMEVHYYAATHALLQQVSDATMQALNSFKRTHDVTIEGVNFWARKKQTTNDD